jgi:GT2 family glycosyltransferase
MTMTPHPDLAALLADADSARRAGDLASARRQYEQALRLAPEDGVAGLALGHLLLQEKNPAAAAPLEHIARRHDVADAWGALAAARVLGGEHEAAEAALHNLLSRHVPPSDPGLGPLAGLVAKATGRPGWCGLDGDGTVRIGLAAGQKAVGLAIDLDGVVIALPDKLPEPVARAAVGPSFQVALAQQEHGKDWRAGQSVRVTLNGQHLIGSPISIRALLRTEGFVSTHNGELEGWAWLPSDPERAPQLAVHGAESPAAHSPATPGDPGDKLLALFADSPCSVELPRPGARPRGFRVSVADLAGFSGLVHVRGPDGRDLLGSPLDPGMEQRSAAAAAAEVRRLFPAASSSATSGPVASGPIEQPGVPADIIGPAASAPPRKRRGLDVVVPVYAGHSETLACLESVLDGLPASSRVWVIEDASPDPALVASLQVLAASGRIRLHRHATNRGFPAAANTGIRLAGDRDVVLLNSDTLCPPGWLARLRAVAFAADDIGTVTPLSNDGSITSYPDPDGGNAQPDLAETLMLDEMARRANGTATVELPTGVGFCMYIRRECIDDVGLLREDVFAQGYGEENDFCMRARHLGWRHVAATGMFVGHVGSRSFGGARRYLIQRNIAVLNRLHPGYDGLVASWIAGDPLALARRRIDIQRWRDAAPTDAAPAGSVVLITHDREGGVQRRVGERCAELRAEGKRPIVLRPARLRDGAPACELDDGTGVRYPNLRYAIPGQLYELTELLRGDRPERVEIHHFIGHDPVLMELPHRLGVPYHVTLHDYAWLCPRITMVGASKHYCGEPGLAGCETCIADIGGMIDEDITPTALLKRSVARLQGAAQVVAPSSDVARRYRRHLPMLRPEVRPLEDDAALRAVADAPPQDGPIKIAVIGALSIEKGYEVLLACARDAMARRMKLAFVLIGFSCGDARLRATGCVTITGRYEEDEAVALIRAQHADLALLPSVWPETWSYTLTQAWQAGLRTMAFDIGAQADRIRATNRGWVLPLGAAPAMTNNALLNAGLQLRGAHSVQHSGLSPQRSGGPT